MDNGVQRRPDSPFVGITARDIYDALRKLEGKVDLLGAQSNAVVDHEQRLRKLESRFVGIAASAVAIVLTGAGVLIWRVATS